MPGTDVPEAIVLRVLKNRRSDSEPILHDPGRVGDKISGGSPPSGNCSSLDKSKQDDSVQPLVVIHHPNEEPDLHHLFQEGHFDFVTTVKSHP